MHAHDATIEAYIIKADYRRLDDESRKFAIELAVDNHLFDFGHYVLYFSVMISNIVWDRLKRSNSYMENLKSIITRYCFLISFFLSLEKFA